MEYRLLKHGEIFESGDEYLMSDLQTWGKIDESVGYKYNQKDWFICRRPLPDKPKVLTAEEWESMHCDEYGDSDLENMEQAERDRYCFTEGHKNGRLEKHQEFEPLIEELTEIIEILDAGSRIDNDLRWNHVRVHLSNLPKP